MVTKMTNYDRTYALERGGYLKECTDLCETKKVTKGLRSYLCSKYSSSNGQNVFFMNLQQKDKEPSITCEGRKFISKFHSLIGPS